MLFGATGLGARAAADAASSPRGRFLLETLNGTFLAAVARAWRLIARCFQVKTRGPYTALCAAALRIVHALRAVTCVEVTHVGRDDI